MRKLFSKEVTPSESIIPPAALGLGICDETVICTPEELDELDADLAAIATKQVVEFPENAEQFYF